MLEGFKKIFGKSPSPEEKKEIEQGQASSVGKILTSEEGWFKEGENLASKPPEINPDADKQQDEQQKAA